MTEVLNYFNGAIALVAAIIYYFNASKCQSPNWKIYKYMLGSCMFTMFLVYMMFVLKMNVDPLVIKLNTSLLILLMISNGILGRSKYGKRC